MLKCFDFSYLGERLIVILLRLLLSIEFLESTMLDRLIFRNIAIPLFLIAFVPVKCLLAFWVTLIQSKSLLNKTLLFSVFEETILELLPSYFLSFDVDDVTASFFAEDFDRSLFLLLLPDKRLIPRMLNLIFKHSDCGVGISGAWAIVFMSVFVTFKNCLFDSGERACLGVVSLQLPYSNLIKTPFDNLLGHPIKILGWVLMRYIGTHRFLELPSL